MAIRKRVSLTGFPFSGENALVLDGVAFDIGSRVIKWWEDEGFSQYGTDRVVVQEEDNATGKVKKKIIQGKRYYERKKGVPSIRQVFIHHAGADRESPKIMHDVLHNQRGLSVQFAIEDDGRIYQFLDAEKAAKHGGTHNQISIGAECCLFPDAGKRPNYYSVSNRRRTGNLPHTTKVETLQGMKKKVFCFTDEQVEAVCRWAAGLWVAIGYLRKEVNELDPNTEIGKLFNEPPVFPKNKEGRIPRKVFKKHMEHVGLIGHLQCSPRKWDPAGFPWEYAEERTGEYFWEFFRRLTVT